MEAKDWDKEAKNYFDNITSPFDKNVKNPIYNAIDSINGKSKSVIDVNKIIEEIYKTLKENGIFIGIFPALGSVLYESILTYDKELEETDDEELARKRTYRVIGKKDYDFLLGMFTNENEGKQKFWYRFEIQYKLKKYGF